MSASFEIAREEYVTPDNLSSRTLHLSPLDVHSEMGTTYISWPFFFDYDVDANLLMDALRTMCKTYPFLCGRILPDEDTRYVIEVGTQNSVTYGIPFSELRSDMTIASAYIEHGQIKNASADYPTNPKVPFLMESFDTESLIKGEIPIVRVRLIHFSNGCAITITVSHLLVDGQRLIEIYRDLGRVYRGEAIPDRFFDRAAFWPGQLVKHYTFLGEDVANMPRKAATPKEELVLPSYPEEIFNTEALYFSKDVLNGMKEAIQPFLADGEFVSTNDLLVGFAWMLQCELRAEEEPVEDNFWTIVSNTTGAAAIELLRNGVHCVPQEFLGNALVFPILSASEADVKDKSILEILAVLALTMRETLAAIQTQPLVAAQTLLAYYMIVHNGAFPLDTSTGRLAISNVSKISMAEVDFGQGAPRIAHTPLVLPILGLSVTCGNAPDGGQGIIMNLAVHESGASRFKNSKTIKTCAPGVKYLYSDFTADDVEAMIEGK